MLYCYEGRIEMGTKHKKQHSLFSEDNSLKRIMKHKSTSVIAGLSISLLTFTSVEALNIGKARTQSYIGQPLSIFVPVSDSAEIIDLNELVISKPSSLQLDELSVSEQTNDLIYSAVTSGSEKGILITSVEPFNEPFIDMGVKVAYKGVTQLRKLTALIDLQPLTSDTLVSSPLNSQENNNNSEVVENSIPTNITDSANPNTSSNFNNRTYSNEIMGPYDWAQAGAVPEKFGPVLDGQSLWRVARRINESMNVSIDQMMWALFRANPQAFSSQDVASLQAGSILAIPKESFIREVTELGAVRLLSTKTIRPNNEDIASDGIETETAPAESFSDEVSITESTVISEVVESDATTNVNDAETNTVVSLSELSAVDELKNEISFLNQQVVAQEERIKVLEERLAVYESSTNTLASSNASNTVDVVEQQATDLSSEVVEADIVSTVDEVDEVVVENEAVVIEAPAASEAITSPTPIQTTQADPVQNESNSATVNKKFTIAKSSLLAIALGGLALFLLGLLAVRNRFIPAMLKLFGDSYEYDETAPLFSSISKKRKSIRNLEQLRQQEDSTEEQNYQQRYKQDSNVISNKTKAENKTKVENKTKAEGEFEDFVDYSFLIDEEDLMDVEEISFPERIKQLIDSGDYDEAKKTLNFAVAANVDDHEINISMLKIFAAESDRESFDKLFERVHENIDKYDAESQLIIAELQSEMTIGNVINFDSDQIAS